MDFQAQGGNERDLHGEFVCQLWSIPRSQEAVDCFDFLIFGFLPVICISVQMSTAIATCGNCTTKVRDQNEGNSLLLAQQTGCRCRTLVHTSFQPGATGSPPAPFERMKGCGTSLARPIAFSGQTWYLIG